jgi:hypothetical protein
MQIVGTFGAAGNVNIEGTNDNANYATLHDPFGNSLAFTSAGIKEVLENTLTIRPNCTAGDGTTSLVCTMIARRPI